MKVDTKHTFKERVFKNSNSQNKRVTFLLLIVTIILVATGVSYAMLPTDNLRNEPVDALASTATIKLRYTDCTNEDAITCGDISANLAPGDSISKEFSVTNVGTKDTTYDIYFRELYNTFENDDLVYTLEDVTNNKVIVSSKAVPKGTKTNKIIEKDILSPVGSTTKYKLTVTFLNRDYDQSINLGAEFSLKLKIGGPESRPQNTMMSRATGEGEDIKISEEGFWSHYANIKRIVFENTLSPKVDATYTYDLSDSTLSAGRVMAYLVPDEIDDTMYTAYIQGKGGVAAPGNSTYLFANFEILDSIENLEYFDTSEVTNMMGMFASCINLTTLNVSNFDTSNVIDMSWMFDVCNSLITLDVSNFDTSNVTNMSSMFYGCNSITSLDVSNFDTSNVTSMNSMFGDCSYLTTLDVSKFNTSKVTDMSWMFSGCNELTLLDLNNFDTSKVTDMSHMFFFCKNLTLLDLKNFNTSNVTDMSFLFGACSSLTTLDLSNFDTSKVINMSSIFCDCVNLTTLDLSSFNTNNATNMSYMFFNCNSLTTLDLSNFDTSNVTDLSRMFYESNKLNTTITIMGTKCSNYYLMFTNAAIEEGAQIVVKYTSDASDLVDKMIATKSDNSNVIKASQPEL